MTPSVAAPNPSRRRRLPAAARAAYEALAPHYDLFTEGYEHDRWLGDLEAVARERGVRGRRALDVACGTGKSFVPLARRGYLTSACDISPAMVAIARTRSAHPERVFVADMRRLPAIGTFDLVTCLNDALNYLLTDEELIAAFRGVARVLARSGVLVFDVNSLRAYRSAFGADFDRRVDGLDFQWRGGGRRRVRPGTHQSALLRVVDGDGRVRSVSRHVQRHHPAQVLRRALRVAGLRPLVTLGQTPGAHLHTTADEAEHTKIVWVCGPVARAADSPRPRERR